jgi:MFS family permease
MSSHKNQYIVTFYVNLLSFGYGLSTGWTSSSLPFLQSSESPLPNKITDDEASIIGSILTIGGFCGTIGFGYLMNIIGRKWTLYLVAFPQIVGWIAMYFAQSSTLLIIFRFLAGFAGK